MHPGVVQYIHPELLLGSLIFCTSAKQNASQNRLFHKAAAATQSQKAVLFGLQSILCGSLCVCVLLSLEQPYMHCGGHLGSYNSCITRSYGPALLRGHLCRNATGHSYSCHCDTGNVQ